MGFLPAGSRLALASFLLLGGVAAPISAHNYVGAERCGSCHPFEYEVWSRGPHARAHLALSADELKDAKCNTCHTMLPNEADPKLAGVQCEQCHGPGRYYQASYVMRDKELVRALGLVDPGPTHCRQCHTEGAPSIEPFDFEAKWARVGHDAEARKAWEAAREALKEGERR